jgi:hypothetical protein
MLQSKLNYAAGYVRCSVNEALFITAVKPADRYAAIKKQISCKVNSQSQILMPACKFHRGWTAGYYSALVQRDINNPNLRTTNVNRLKNRASKFYKNRIKKYL